VRSLVQRSDVGEFRRRYRWLVLGVLVIFAVMTGRVAELQLLEGEVHRTQAHRNIIRRVSLATTRGVIRDTQGKVLAANRPSYNVYVVPEKVDLKQTWPQVVNLMQLTRSEASELEDKIRKLRADDRRKSQQILLKVDVDRDVVAVHLDVFNGLGRDEVFPGIGIDDLLQGGFDLEG
jgi:penicillin-binding protein 2